MMSCLSINKGESKLRTLGAVESRRKFESHRRKVRSALYEGEKRESTAQIFRAGQGKRMNKKVKSHVDNGGTLGRVITTRRFSNSYIHVTCKTVNKW